MERLRRKQGDWPDDSFISIASADVQGPPLEGRSLACPGPCCSRPGSPGVEFARTVWWYRPRIYGKVRNLMETIADLHLHSRFSIATGKEADLEHLDLWGRYKGVQVVGTGDCTHPEWL